MRRRQKKIVWWSLPQTIDASSRASSSAFARRPATGLRAVPCRRSVRVDDLDFAADQAPGVSRRLGERRRAQEETRIAPVVPGDAHETTEDVRHARSEDAAEGVDFVDDDVGEVAEELRPLGVIRKDAGVEHPGVREHEVSAVAQRASDGRRRVAVVGEGVPGLAERLDDAGETGGLILRQRLRREQEERARAALRFEERLEHRDRVAERLARRGRRRDEDVPAGERGADRARLVLVELADAARAVEVDEASIDAGREVIRTGGARRDRVPALEARAEARVMPQRVGDREHAAGGLGDVGRHSRRSAWS